MPELLSRQTLLRAVLAQAAHFYALLAAGVVLVYSWGVGCFLGV